jgi:predicted nucleic acid-binding protein
VTSAFWDSSAFVKLLIEEPGRDLAVEMWNAAERNIAARLAVPEVSAAIATAKRSGRLDAASEREVRRRWTRHLDGIEFVELLARVGRDAADLAAEHDLSGADSVHLASLLALREMDLALVTWDRRLAAAAAAEGLPVVPGDL